MLTAFYDLSKSPPTYDFISFLVAAEVYRQKVGEKWIYPQILPGPADGFRKDNLAPDLPMRCQMLREVVVESCRLLPSVSHVTVHETREQVAFGDKVFPEKYTLENALNYYGLRVMVECWNQSVFPLRYPEKTEKLDNLITITLRQTPYWPSRNSSVLEWEKAADYMEKEGYEVIIIPDVYKKPISLMERMELYETAAWNFFINNGPSWAAVFDKNVNGSMFKMISSGAPCVSQQSFEDAGFPPGSQIPRDNFRIIWKGDSYDNIIEEFEFLREVIL